MSLSIRHPKGILSRRWYWDCRINDRSVSVGLCKIKSLSKEEKADLRRLKSLEDIEAFLALC